MKRNYMVIKLLEPVTEWLFAPTVGKIVTVIFGIIIINVLARVNRRLLLVTVFFSNKLENLILAFGVAGAGMLPSG